MARWRRLLLVLGGLALPLACVAGSAAHAPRATAAGKAQPGPSLFGLNLDQLDASHSNLDKDYARAKQLGARWVHFGPNSVHWNGKLVDFSSLDHGVKRARDQGLGVLISLGGDPKACSVQPTPSSPANCPPSTAADLNIYKAFLKQELLRYASSVTYYESWVGPNVASHWLPQANAAQYAALLQAQYSVFQSVNELKHLQLKLLFGGPTEFGLAPGSSSGIAVLPFTHAVLDDLGGQRPFDGVALEDNRTPPATRPPSFPSYDDIKGLPVAPGDGGPYPAQGCNNTGTYCKMTWPEEISAYEQEFRNDGYPQQPLWLTQFGWPGNAKVPPNPQPSAQFYPLYAVQTKDLKASYHDLLKRSFVKAAFWFDIRDSQPGRLTGSQEYYSRYGLLQYNGAPKPAAATYTALSQQHPHR